MPSSQSQSQSHLTLLVNFLTFSSLRTTFWRNDKEDDPCHATPPPISFSNTNSTSLNYPERFSPPPPPPTFNNFSEYNWWNPPIVIMSVTFTSLGGELNTFFFSFSILCWWGNRLDFHTYCYFNIEKNDTLN